MAQAPAGSSLIEGSEQQDGGHILQRSSSHASHKLLRTVSQKLRSLTYRRERAAENAAHQQKDTKLFRRGGEVVHSSSSSSANVVDCRCRVRPEDSPPFYGDEEDGIVTRIPDIPKTTWCLRLSRGRDHRHRFHNDPVNASSLDDDDERIAADEEHEQSRHARNRNVGCFGLERDGWKLRSSSRRMKPSSSSSSPESPPTSSFWGIVEENIQGDAHLQQEQQQQQPILLPDEILEMCLARVSFVTLVRARAVCKRWRMITLSPHFFHLRERMTGHRPWLFLFGLSRDGVCMGQIQALDPTLDRWHTMRADVLAGRLLYSAAAIGSNVYVVGGCSARAKGDKALKTHRGVLLLDALTGQWRKVGAMITGRTTPVVGVFEIKDRKSLFSTGNSTSRRNHGLMSSSNRQREIGVYRGGSLASTRHYRLMEIMGRRNSMQQGDLWEAYQELEREDQRRSSRNCSSSRRCCSSSSSTSAMVGNSEAAEFGLIVVGGQGEWNQTLNSGEIYDPVMDSWKEIACWPAAEYGSLCTGVVCNGLFFGYSDTDKLAAYDFQQGAWRGFGVSYVPPRIQEYLPKLVVCAGRLFLLGVAWAMRGNNNDQAKAARKLWRLEESGGISTSESASGSSSSRWAEVSQHPDAPLDWNAVFVSHREKIYGVEMFKIFGQVLDFVTVCDVVASGAGQQQQQGPRWDRVSRRRMAHDMDASSCLTKTAVVVEL